jgi:hypothetical protein
MRFDCACKTLRSVDKYIQVFVVKSEVRRPLQIARHTWEKYYIDLGNTE